ncbi:hypothetical protein ES705_14445 [subsurface metagenome]
MAKIIVGRDQQAEVRRRYPKPAYSRIVNLEVLVADGLDGVGFNYTPPLGNRLWLLSVDLWFINPTLDVLIGGFVYLRTGDTKPESAGEVAMKWQSVIDDSTGIKPGIYWTGLNAHFHWDMMRFYEGRGRRFGVMIENFNQYQQWLAWASFQISEG